MVANIPSQVCRISEKVGGKWTGLQTQRVQSQGLGIAFLTTSPLQTPLSIPDVALKEELLYFRAQIICA